MNNQAKIQTASSLSAIETQVYEDAFAFVIGKIADLSTLSSKHTLTFLRRSEKISLYATARSTCLATLHERKQRIAQLQTFIASRQRAAKVVGLASSLTSHRKLIQQLSESVFDFVQSQITMQELQVCLDNSLKSSPALFEFQLLSCMELACRKILAETEDMLVRSDALNQHIRALTGGS